MEDQIKKEDLISNDHKNEIILGSEVIEKMIKNLLEAKTYGDLRKVFDESEEEIDNLPNTLTEVMMNLENEEETHTGPTGHEGEE